MSSLTDNCGNDDPEMLRQNKEMKSRKDKMSKYRDVFDVTGGWADGLKASLASSVSAVGT